MHRRHFATALTFIAALSLSVAAPLSAGAATESGITPTCVAGARPLVRGEQTSLNTLRVDMPSGTIRHNNATKYYLAYQHPTMTRASWYASSISLKDSGTYGICAPV